MSMAWWVRQSSPKFVVKVCQSSAIGTGKRGHYKRFFFFSLEESLESLNSLNSLESLENGRTLLCFLSGTGAIPPPIAL